MRECNSIYWLLTRYVGGGGGQVYNIKMVHISGKAYITETIHRPIAILLCRLRFDHKDIGSRYIIVCSLQTFLEPLTHWCVFRNKDGALETDQSWGLVAGH